MSRDPFSQEPESAPMQVAILGAGISGICMGIRLLQAGFDGFTIFDKEDRIGGTWRDNTYPGSGCDVPSFFYSFSFDPKTDWSRAFAEQPEILDYLESLVDRHGLRSYIRFRTEIASARFDDDRGLWHLRTVDGETFTARTVVTGLGQLNRPYVPDVAGLESFRGTTFHSARWRHDHDLAGERVGVIGNGASAIQFVPRIAPETRHLTIFQRSPNWIVTKPDRPYTEKERRFFTRHPLATRLHRFLIWSLLEIRWPAFSRRSRVFSRWLERMARKKLEDEVKDPKLREILTPSYPIGAKRILISNDYYQTLNRDDVDVETAPIEKFVPEGIVTADGRVHELDTVIFATGFESTRFLAPLRIENGTGESLENTWRNGAEAYMGVAVAGFPNLFMLYGPNTNLGHNSIILMIECQVRYILQLMEKLFREDVKLVDVRQEAMDRYNREIQEALEDSVWTAVSRSWYKTASGRITNNWAYSTIRYWWRTRKPDFPAFRIEKAEARSEDERLRGAA